MPIHTAVSAIASPKSFVITPPLTQMPATSDHDDRHCDRELKRPSDVPAAHRPALRQPRNASSSTCSRAGSMGSGGSWPRTATVRRICAMYSSQYGHSREMRLEPLPIEAEQCSLQVLGDQLDQLAARHLLSIAARHVG